MMPPEGLKRNIFEVLFCFFFYIFMCFLTLQSGIFTTILNLTVPAACEY